jgi:hypothetical protein
MDMKENASFYLERAQEYETKAEQIDDPVLRITYQELARSYRALATHDPKAKEPRKAN